MSSSKIASTVPSTDNCPCFKLVLVGDGFTGKTTFLRRLGTSKFDNVYAPTVGLEVNNLKFNTNRGKVQFACWDIGGQDLNAGVEDRYYTYAQCAIVMFDFTDRETYDKVRSWRHGLRSICGNIPIAVCGNKVEMEKKEVDPRKISFRDIKDIHNHEISVKHNINLKKPFLSLARDLLRDPSLDFVENDALAEAQTYPEVEMWDANVCFPEKTAPVPRVADINPAMQSPPNPHFAENAAPAAPSEVEMQDADVCFSENIAPVPRVADINPAGKMRHESPVAVAASTSEPLNNVVHDTCSIDGRTTIEFTCCCGRHVSVKLNPCSNDGRATSEFPCCCGPHVSIKLHPSAS